MFTNVNVYVLTKPKTNLVSDLITFDITFQYIFSV